MYLRCANLHRSFKTASGPLHVLKGVTLEVARAQVVAILGPSGSGKSTLLHLLAGLDRPNQGEIYWGDLALNKSPINLLAQARAAQVGLVFQQHYLLEDLTALENVTLAGRIRGELDLRRGEYLLKAVGLSERADFLPAKLSGGERQRVAVARALYTNPGLILADEPTGSLDRESARSVYALLVDLARTMNSAVIMVTHDEGLVEDVDRRYYLRDGVLVEAATMSS